MMRRIRSRGCRHIAGQISCRGKEYGVIQSHGAGIRKIDIGGKTCFRLHDAHSHPAQAGLSHLRMVDCDLRSISAFRQRCASGRKDAGWRMVLGFKYDDTKTEDGRPLSIAIWIGVPDHPIHIEHRGGHTSTQIPWLRKAGIDEKTPILRRKIEHDQPRES